MTQLPSFEDQLAALLRKAETDEIRLMTGLTQAMTIIQEAKRQGLDDAIAHLINVITPDRTATPAYHGGALSAQEQLDREFDQARAVAAQRAQVRAH